MALSDPPLTMDQSFEAEIQRLQRSLHTATMDSDDLINMMNMSSMRDSPLPRLDRFAHTQHTSRQESLYDLARQAAGMHSPQPGMPTIKEAQSVDYLPLAGQCRTSGDFRPIDWLSKSASILPEAYITNSPVSSPVLDRKGPPANAYRTPMANHVVTVTAPPQPVRHAYSTNNMNDDALDMILHGYLEAHSVPQPFTPTTPSPLLGTPLASSPHLGGDYGQAFVFPSSFEGMNMYQQPMASPTLADLLQARVQRSMSAPTSPTLLPGFLRKQNMLARQPSNNASPSQLAAAAAAQAAAIAHATQNTVPGGPGDPENNICSNCGVMQTVLWRLSKLNDRMVCAGCTYSVCGTGVDIYIYRYMSCAYICGSLWACFPCTRFSSPSHTA